jgi:hypothetical protein
MSDNGQDLTVYAYPSKSFFIDMLTRDIGLTEWQDGCADAEGRDQPVL